MFKGEIVCFSNLSRDAIIEEKCSKSLPESEKMNVRRNTLSKCTPRVQVRRQQTLGASLLSSSSSSSMEDEA